MRDCYLSRSDLLIFGIPFAILVLLPLVCYFAVYVTQDPSGITSDAMLRLFVAVAFWIMLPGFVFREPFFDPVEIGYSPHGFLGWTAVLAFWAAVSISTSFVVRYSRRRAQRRRNI